MGYETELKDKIIEKENIQMFTFMYSTKAFLKTKRLTKSIRNNEFKTSEISNNYAKYI